MPALSSAGLAHNDSSPIHPCELASPTRSVPDKSTSSFSSFSLTSDTSLSNCTLYTVLEAPCFYHNPDTPHADHRRPGATNHQSEIKRRSRPPGSRPARPLLQAGRQTARNGPRAPTAERTRSRDQQRGLALDLEDRAAQPTEGRPSEAVRSCPRSCSRWSA